MEAGQSSAASAASQGTARRGSAGKNGCAARTCKGGEARHGSGLAGGRSCFPARHSPKGTHGRTGARRGMQGRGSAEKRTRACGRPLLPLRKAQPEGDAGGRGGAARACKGGKARHGSGLAEAALAASQAQSEGDAWENGCAARHAREGKRAVGTGSRRPLLPPCKAQSEGDAGKSGGAPQKRDCGRPILPLRKAQPEGDAGERCAARACKGEEARHGSGIAEAAPAAL